MELVEVVDGAEACDLSEADVGRLKYVDLLVSRLLLSSCTHSAGLAGARAHGSNCFG